MRTAQTSNLRKDLHQRVPAPLGVQCGEIYREKVPSEIIGLMTHPFSWLGGESLSKDLNRDGDDEGYFALHYIDSSKDIGIDDIYHVQEVSEDLQRFSINEHGFSLTSREEYAVESLEIQEESQEAGLSHSLAWQHGIRAGIRMTT